MTRTETIVAAATPPGRGGVGIVRISGPKTPELGAILLGELPAARYATLARFLDAQQNPIDAGLALFFPAPHSYTGEHVLELHGHGGPLVMEALVDRVLELGARRALPGEFTQRAFLNDKLDLAQAEAIADLIDAGSRAAARAAMRSLQGEFSAMVRGLTEAVIELRTYVEAAIDFPEEEIDFLADRELGERFRAMRAHFAGVLESARVGRLLREGMTVVIAGPPNAGKSSLLNRLAGYDAAIVTPIPGTTRDVLRERIHLDGMPLHVLDTAGLRAGGDIVEEEGVRRAQAEMQRAERVLFVIDAAADPEGSALRRERARALGRDRRLRRAPARPARGRDGDQLPPHRAARPSRGRNFPERAPGSEHRSAGGARRAHGRGRARARARARAGGGFARVVIAPSRHVGASAR